MTELPPAPLLAATRPGQPGAAGVSASDRAVLAQLLATEHWSLLATRSQTWSEVMSRITIHLTVASASLVVLALVVQSSGFGTAFNVLSIGMAATIWVLGTLTSFRVQFASQDDGLLVVAMNRLRAAYVELVPEVGRHLTASTHDDQDGLMATYLLGARRPLLMHVIASTSFYIGIVNTIVAGALAALVARAAGSGATGITVAGVVAAVLHFGLGIAWARRLFRYLPTGARNPTPPA